MVVLYDGMAGISITPDAFMDNTLPTQSFRAEQVESDLVNSTSFTVKAGECLCISGPSGAGKTLLLRALADLDEHYGKVWLGEKESRSIAASSWRRSVAYIPAESYWWQDTVAEHFPVRMEDALSKLGFPEEVMQWQVSRLSTGEKQRLALLRALQFSPDVLLLDEPTANMDEESTAKVEALILGYMREHNASVVWVSHSKEQIERIADQHMEMSREKAA